METLTLKQRVLDYKGCPIPRHKARKIRDQYYEEGVTCIKMPDGKWYRVTTGKIVFDHEEKKWWFTDDAPLLCSGFVDVETKNNKLVGVTGAFKSTYKNIVIRGENNTPTICINEAVAEKLGFVENLNDGLFCKKENLPYKVFKPIEPPGSARTNTYSLDDDLTTKETLITNYNNLSIKVDRLSKNIEQLVPYTFGIEMETSLGFLPDRLAHNIGVRALRDGSVSGIEYVTVPLCGAKGVQVTKLLCDELTRRSDIDNKCSIHIHFGNVRRDKLYVISLWTLFLKIQTELALSFPFSRTNQVAADRKVYCKLLPHLDLDVAKLVKSKSKKEFQSNLTTEFNKIYGFLNSAQDGTYKKTGDVISKTLVRIDERRGENACWKLGEELDVFSTKHAKHTVSGPKWNRPSRYYALNLLPLFFSNAHTIEFRLHEATTRFEKTAMWMLICSAILQAAEDFNFVFLNNLTLTDVFTHVYGSEVASHLVEYLAIRKATFCDKNGVFKENWNTVETAWLAADKKIKLDLEWLT